MLQQTTVATVRERFNLFLARWPTVAALAAADDSDVLAAWAGLGYYARARNLIACARAVVQVHDGIFPVSEDALRGLPGIGPYTAAAIAAFAFGQRAVVVDGNVERVVSRLFAIDMPIPAARPEIYRAMDSVTPDARAGDFAQAMMDLAAAICQPKRTDCLICPLHDDCAGRAMADPLRFPVKAARKSRPVRHGEVWWVARGDQVLLVRRPEKGLLGGMRGLPGSDWRDGPGEAVADVVHVFTHFELRLRIMAMGADEAVAQDVIGEYWPIEQLDEAGLPTLYTKVADKMGAG
jgi:A/G-specific adenine glycosylase